MRPNSAFQQQLVSEFKGANVVVYAVPGGKLLRPYIPRNYILTANEVFRSLTILYLYMSIQITTLSKRRRK